MTSSSSISISAVKSRKIRFVAIAPARLEARIGLLDRRDLQVRRRDVRDVDRPPLTAREAAADRQQFVNGVAAMSMSMQPSSSGSARPEPSRQCGRHRRRNSSVPPPITLSTAWVTCQCASHSTRYAATHGRTAGRPPRFRRRSRRCSGRTSDVRPRRLERRPTLRASFHLPVFPMRGIVARIARRSAGHHRIRVPSGTARRANGATFEHESTSGFTVSGHRPQILTIQNSLFRCIGLCPMLAARPVPPPSCLPPAPSAVDRPAYPAARHPGEIVLQANALTGALLLAALALTDLRLARRGAGRLGRRQHDGGADGRRAPRHRTGAARLQRRARRADRVLFAPINSRPSCWCRWPRSARRSCARACRSRAGAVPVFGRASPLPRYGFRLSHCSRQARDTDPALTFYPHRRAALGHHWTTFAQGAWAGLR